ncbi:MAG: aspartyl-tRNA synthetase [Myxococcota bacterium]
MGQFIDDIKRTHNCGALRLEDAAADVVLFGWVDGYRDHGGCVFIDLRDRDGITQVVFDKGEVSEDTYSMADTLRNEWVIGVSGTVRDRGEMRNARIETGNIEVVGTTLQVFNKSLTPPFAVDETAGGASEERRLKYRFIDLRRPPMQRNLMRRSRVARAVRNYFGDQDFVEIETPMIVKYTPGGARNFIVPSRLHSGKFYALAESPQLYKQMLMVSGYEKYFQIVKCFRDEDLRIDRQPEFTQIDIEMSFITQDDLFNMVEGVIVAMFKAGLDVDLTEQYPGGKFPRLDFYEAMDKYGSDKPDLRFDMPHTDLTALVVEHKGGGIPFFQPIAECFESGEYRLDLPKEIIKAMVIPASSGFSRKDLDGLEGFVKQMGAAGLGRAKVGENGEWTQSPLKKFATDEFRTAVNEITGAKAGDIIVFQSGAYQRVQTVMANLRTHVAKRMGLIPESGSGGVWNLSWVVAPPLFEAEEDGGWAAAHHAFTRPYNEDVSKVEEDPGKVRCYRYDLVLNGFEIGGGSIRLHDPAVQAAVFRTLGIPEEEAQRLFGFLLNALSFGAPPHGGIALGLDRIMMIMCETGSIRDVVAFPKTQKGTSLLTGAPDPVSDKQLEEANIRVLGPKS